MTAGGDAEQRRLLVISFHFPPDGSVGGLRWAGISKYLARRGWEVHVLTAAPQGGRAVSDGVHVHYCARRRTLNDAYNSWKRRAQPAGSAGGATGVSSSAAPSTGGFAWLRRNVGASLGFPDVGRGWIVRAGRLASRLLRGGDRRFDAVVSSGPPHSAHLAAVLARASGQAPFWVDMRDPWAALVHTHWLQGLYGSALMKRTIPWIERRVFASAYRVVANTAQFADQLREANPALRVSYVPNGIDLERLPPPATAKFDGLSIAYAGSLYAGRHLGVVLSALERFLRAHPDARGTTRLRVAGRTEAPHEARFWADVDAAQLRDVVEFRGELSPAAALDMVNRSHIALVLAQDQPVQVPAKVYECVGLRIPTVVIAESTSAAAGEAGRIGAMVCEPADVDGMCRIIERSWLRPATGDAPRAEISYMHIAEQVESLLLSDASAYRVRTPQ